jgi:hypothetical protein
LLRPQIDDAAGLAGRAFDAARIADHDLDPDADVAADVRGERRSLRFARGFVGMVGARLDQEPLPKLPANRTYRRHDGTDANDPISDIDRKSGYWGVWGATEVA